MRRSFSGPNGQPRMRRLQTQTTPPTYLLPIDQGTVIFMMYFIHYVLYLGSIVFMFILTDLWKAIETDIL